jgi:hypothetical protein
MRIDSRVQKALDDCGAPWELKQGGSHYKIIVNGKLAGVLPKKGGDAPMSRSMLNTITQIRRAARGAQ